MTELTDELFTSITFPIFAPVSLRIEPDWLGDVNSVVRIMRNNLDGTHTSLRAALVPRIKAGTKVSLSRDAGNFFTGPTWEYFAGHGDESTWRRPWSLPTWYVEVDGRRVLEIPEHDIWPAIPPPQISWRRRARRAITRRYRVGTDAIARQLGYVRIGHCDCGDGDF